VPVSYKVIRAEEHVWDERPAAEGEAPRRLTELTTSAALSQSRARIWRYPPHARGRRHLERAQEEVFLVLSGTLTMLLGDPPERVELPPQSVVSVAPGTALQLRNEGDDELVLFAYGAPPVIGQAEYLDDVEL
jgi:mannose-6-phosphate isomerase-like protein (cupin superfamily)